MAKDTFTIPTGGFGGSPGRKGEFDFGGYGGPDRREKKRITIEELNREGIEALRTRPELLEPKDERTAFETVLDWLDVPRNIVAHGIARLAGMQQKDFAKIQERGTWGMKQVRMSEILRHLGVKNDVVRGIVGFVGDVAIDPLLWASLGSTTGKAIARWLPRVKASGWSQLKAARSGVVASELAEALGPAATKAVASLVKRGKGKALLAGRGGGYLTQWLARNVVRGDSIGAAARAWMAKYGIGGRNVFRMPFTQVAGPLIKRGKMARAYKAMLTGAEDVAKLSKVGLAGRAIGTTRLAQRFLDAQREARKTGNLEAVKRIGRKLKDVARRGEEQFWRLGHEVKFRAKAMTGLEQMARSDLVRATNIQDAPDVLKLWQSVIMGPADAPKGTWKYFIRHIFGPPPSYMHQTELAAHYRRSIGALQARRQAYASMQPITDDLVRHLVQQGTWGTDEKQVTQLLGHMMDIGDELQALHPKDWGRQFWAEKRLGEMMADPKVLAFRKAFQAKLNAVLRVGRKSGLPTGYIPSYFARTASEAAKPHLGEQLERVGGKGLQYTPTYGASTVQPFVHGRTAMVEYGKAGSTPINLLSTEVDDIARLTREGYLPAMMGVKKGEDPIYFGIGHVASPEISTPAELAAAVSDYGARGYRVRPANWRLSASHYDWLIQEGGKGTGLQTILGDIGAEQMKQQRASLFNMDPATSFSVRMSQHEQAMAALDLKRLAREHAALVLPHGSQGVTPDSLQSMGLAIPKLPTAQEHPFVRLLGRTIYGQIDDPNTLVGRLAFPVPVTEMLNRATEVWNGTEGVNKLIGATDMGMAWFKRWALFHPAYILRNMWQNFFGTLMAGGKPMRAAHWAFGSKEVRSIWDAIEKGTVNQLKGSVTLAGRNYTLKELAGEALRMNMATGGQTAQIVPDAFRGAGRAKDVARQAAFAGRRIGDTVRTLNAHVETAQRLGGWFSFMELGMAPKPAAMQTLLAMPDLSDITKFERNILARIWPWYRWMKKNGALQLLHYLPSQPAWMASVDKFQNFAEGMSHLWRAEGVEDVPQELRARWMREMQAAQVFGDTRQGAAWLMRSWFPFEEMQSLATGAVEPGEMMRYLFGSMRPGIKFGAEMATGSDIFRRQPRPAFKTEDLPGLVPKALIGASGTALDNLAAIRPLREYGRRVWEQPTVAGGIGRAVLGGAIQPLSSEAGLREIDLRTTELLAELRRHINRAMENRDMPNVQALLAQFVQVLRERQRLGLKIPKASVGALAGAGMTAERAYPGIERGK